MGIGIIEKILGIGLQSVELVSTIDFTNGHRQEWFDQPA